MIKNFINRNLRGLALFSMILALVSAALATASPAAAQDCITGSPTPCALIVVEVVDANTGLPVNDAKVTLIDAYGNLTYAQILPSDRAGGSTYFAYVVPGYYKVTASAPNYNDFTTDTGAKPAEQTTVKTPLLANSRQPTAPTLSTTFANS